MHFTKVLAFAFLLAGSAVAAPGAPHKDHPPPPSPPTNQQSNSCGNDAEPYCCYTDEHGKYTTCSVYDGSTCSQTFVCCNANNVAINVCLGNAQITQ